MAADRIVIVGGSDAGTAAALAARRRDPHCRVEVLLRDEFPNYSICGVPFLLSGEVDDWRRLAHRTQAEIEHLGIVLCPKHEAVDVDPSRQAVTVDSPGGRRVVSYDRLVLATGAEAIIPDISGTHLDGVFVLRTMNHALSMLERIESGSVQDAAIVGGGYVGSELADALTRRRIRVTFIESGARPLKTVDPELGSIIAEELERNGVRVAPNVRVESIREVPGSAGRRLEVRGKDELVATAEMVIVATGVRPQSDLARTAGCVLSSRGAIVVSRAMETNVPGILAAGDCAETWHRLLAAPTYLPLGTTAHKQGAVAGDNAAGGRSEFGGTLGTQVVRIFDLAIARTGLLDSEAIEAGFQSRSRETLVLDHKAYYPGARDLRIRITGNARDGRLLGLQIAGDYRAAVAKRIDVAAAALFAGLTVRQLLDLDLSYTPPLGSPWDPLQTAADAWCSQ